MLLKIVKQFNWVDIFLLILLIRTLYISIKTGFRVEIFKLLGTLTAIYLAMHYYTLISDMVGNLTHLSRQKYPVRFWDFLCFTGLFLVGYFIFVAFRVAFLHFLKIEAVPALQKWGGFLLGIFRTYLLLGVVVYMLFISDVIYLRDSAVNSYSGKYLVEISPSTYKFLWKGFFSKFADKEEYNKTVPEVLKEFNR